MEKYLEHGLGGMDGPEPSNDLFDRVMKRIQKEKLRVKRRRFIEGVLFGLSTFVSFFVFYWYHTELNTSGFFEFVSLFFSDPQIILTYWQTFAFVLLESIPVIQGTFLFIGIFFLCESIRFFSSAADVTKNHITLEV